MSDAFLFAAAFLASAVEMVEALTIVLAVGITRDWRSALTGASIAAVALAVIVTALGPALTLVPINALRLVVGALLLVFGLQWLRKAILRASGYRAAHDESEVFRREVQEARNAESTRRVGLDWYSFAISFKGVLLEGLEVVFIVVTFGSTQHRVPLVAAAASSALVLVATVGVLVRAPLSRAPENAMKFIVGVMLTTFGIFWGAEGTGVKWPGGEIALLAILGFVGLSSLALVRLLRLQRASLEAAVARAER